MNPPATCPGCGTSLDVNPDRCHWDRKKRQTICGDCHEHRREILDMGNKGNPKPKRKGQRYYIVDGGGFAEMTKEKVEHMARIGETMPLVYFGRLSGPVTIGVEQPPPKVTITVPDLKRSKDEDKPAR